MSNEYDFDFSVKNFFHQQVAADQEFAKYAEDLKTSAKNKNILSMKGAAWALGNIVDETFGTDSQQSQEWHAEVDFWVGYGDVSYVEDLVTPEEPTTPAA